MYGTQWKKHILKTKSCLSIRNVFIQDSKGRGRYIYICVSDSLESYPKAMLTILRRSYAPKRREKNNLAVAGVVFHRGTTAIKNRGFYRKQGNKSPILEQPMNMHDPLTRPRSVLA